MGAGTKYIMNSVDPLSWLMATALPSPQLTSTINTPIMNNEEDKWDLSEWGGPLDWNSLQCLPFVRNGGCGGGVQASTEPISVSPAVVNAQQAKPKRKKKRSARSAEPTVRKG